MLIVSITTKILLVCLSVLSVHHCEVLQCIEMDNFPFGACVGCIGPKLEVCNANGRSPPMMMKDDDCTVQFRQLIMHI